MGRSRAVQVLLALSALALGVHVVHTLFGFGGGPSPLFDAYIYNGVMLSAAALCLTRAALVETDRGAWLAFGLAMASYSAAEIYWSVEISPLPSPPAFSAADVLYLGFYPFVYVGLVLLARPYMRPFRPSLWLDGVIGALTVGAVGLLLVFERVIASTGGSAEEIAINLAYPLGDLVMLGMVVVLSALAGWQQGRAIVLVALSMAVAAVADGVYLYQSAADTYVEGGPLDSAWLVSVVLLGWAAWQPLATGRSRPERVWLVGVPAAFGFVALGVLSYGAVTHQSDGVAAWLARAALLGVVVRLVLAFRENLVLLAASRMEATLDPLTGLNNRRTLMRDIDSAFEPGNDRPQVLVLLDLDGFKPYNDALGHTAGDSMLMRLAAKLAAAAPAGRAYRYGGDEFCALLDLGDGDGDGDGERLATDLAAQLHESAEGFDIRASCGFVVVPREARDRADALRLADERLYDRKAARDAAGAEPEEANAR